MYPADKKTPDFLKNMNQSIMPGVWKHLRQHLAQGLSDSCSALERQQTTLQRQRVRAPVMGNQLL